MTNVVNDATIQDIIDSAAQFYGVDPIYAKVVAFQRSEFNDKQNTDHGLGLYALEPADGLSVADLLNPITNAHVGIKALGGTTPDTVSEDLIKAVQNGTFPPNWNNGINRRTGLTVTFEDPAPVETAVTDTPTEAPAPTSPEPPIVVGIISISIPTGTPSEQASAISRFRTALENGSYLITKEVIGTAAGTFWVELP